MTGEDRPLTSRRLDRRRRVKTRLHNAAAARYRARLFAFSTTPLEVAIAEAYERRNAREH